MISRSKAKRIFLLIAGLAMIGVVVVSLARLRAIRVDSADQLASYSDQPLRDVLIRHVSEGLVDYEGLNKQSRKQLDVYLDGVARFGPRSTPGAFPDSKGQLAYYLNTYNAIMLR